MVEIEAAWGDNQSRRTVTGRVGESRSHALGGNAVFDAPRRDHRPGWAAERPGRHSHAERGNEEKGTKNSCSTAHSFSTMIVPLASSSVSPSLPSLSSVPISLPASADGECHLHDASLRVGPEMSLLAGCNPPNSAGKAGGFHPPYKCNTGPFWIVSYAERSEEFKQCGVHRFRAMIVPACISWATTKPRCLPFACRFLPGLHWPCSRVVCKRFAARTWLPKCRSTLWSITRPRSTLG